MTPDEEAAYDDDIDECVDAVLGNLQDGGDPSNEAQRRLLLDYYAMATGAGKAPDYVLSVIFDAGFRIGVDVDEDHTCEVTEAIAQFENDQDWNASEC